MDRAELVGVTLVVFGVLVVAWSVATLVSVAVAGVIVGAAAAVGGIVVVKAAAVNARRGRS